MKPITSDLIKVCREKFAYDADTGNLFWRNTRIDYLDKIAGGIRSDGYKQVRVGGEMYLAHRVIWGLCVGPIDDPIDHINGDRSDNRISNLRLATPSQNQQNRKLQSNNSSGASGVYYHKNAGKWAARAGANKKSVWIGLFDSKIEATNARHSFAKTQFGEFFRDDK
ncbi:MAG: HNH endonuclease signature motif containing protein [bacterium]